MREVQIEPFGTLARAGRFGPYGGRYVPETLMAALEELEAAYENAKQDQHDADGEVHRQAELWRNDDPEHDDCRSDRHDRDSVPDAPGRADQHRARHAVLATDDRRNGNHVVGVGRMPHPEQEAENEERHDARGDSGHCARAMMAILGRIMQGFDRTPNPKCTAPGGRAALGTQLDTRLCH